MEPDLIRKKKYLGQPVDVWALGIILFLLITSGIPFWDETDAESKKEYVRAHCRLKRLNIVKN